MDRPKLKHIPKCPTLKALLELEVKAFVTERKGYIEEGTWEKTYLIIRQRYNWHYALMAIKEED